MPNLETPVSVWQLQLSGLQTATYAALLNTEETQRFQRFLDPHKAHEFACVRGSLRLAIAQQLQCSAQSLDFAYSADKKPYCPQYPQLAFNVSHSHGAALLALNLDGCALGIDIEAQREVDILGLSKRFFSLSEQGALAQISDQMLQTQAFFRIWSRKEACVKAYGKGIATGLSTFSVNHQLPAQITQSSEFINPNAQWSVHHLAFPQLTTDGLSFAAALVCTQAAAVQVIEHQESEAQLWQQQ